MLVAVLVASLLGVVWPEQRAEAATNLLFLKGDGVPKASLSSAVPLTVILPNYDPSRSDEPGLALQRSNKGWSENNQKKYQIWVGPTGGMDIDGDVTLAFWSAMRGHANNGKGRVEAYLLDCTPGGGNCTIIDQGVVESQPWAQTPEWVGKTIDFGTVVHTVASNRALVLKIVVGESATDDMVFAYDTVIFDSGLSMTGRPTVTTSTSLPPTTTSLPVPSTIIPPGSTTSVPVTTTSTSAVTTTIVAKSSTTTTVPATTASTRPSSPNATLAVVGGSGGDDDGGGPGASGTQGTQPSQGGGVVVNEDPAVAAIGTREAQASMMTEETSWAGSALDGLELVMPPWAAGMVVSPLMVIGFVFEAMTDSGRAILLPLGLLLAGMLWVLLESRGFATLVWKKRRPRREQTR